MNRQPIKTLEDIKARCIEDGDMWIWQGCYTMSGNPACKINGRFTTAMRAAYILKHGAAKLPDNKRVWSKTRDVRDVNPDNAMVGTIAEHNKWRAQDGRMRGPANQIAATKARDKIGRKFSYEQADQIRASDKSERELAEAYGCSKALIGFIRRGQIYTRSATVGASVFSWRPA